MYITPFVLNYHLSDIKNITNIYQNVNYASHVNFTRFILDSEASQKYKQYTKKKHPQRYRADSSCKCSTKPISFLLTRILNTEYSEGETSKILYNNILQLEAM